MLRRVTERARQNLILKLEKPSDAPLPSLSIPELFILSWPVTRDQSFQLEPNQIRALIETKTKPPPIVASIQVSQMGSNFDKIYKHLAMRPRTEVTLAAAAGGGAMQSEDQLALITMLINFVLDADRLVTVKNLQDYEAFCRKKWFGGGDFFMKDEDFDFLMSLIWVVQGIHPDEAVRRAMGLNLERVGRSDWNQSTNKMAHIESVVKMRSDNQMHVFQDDGSINRNPASHTTYNGRFDTILCRSLIFIQNIYRVVHLAIARSRTDHTGEAVVEGLEAARADFEWGAYESREGPLTYQASEGFFRDEKVEGESQRR